MHFAHRMTAYDFQSADEKMRGLDQTTKPYDEQELKEVYKVSWTTMGDFSQ